MSIMSYLILSIFVTVIWSIVLKLLQVKYVWPPLAFFMWIFIIPVIALQLISNQLMKYSEELAEHLINIIPQKVKPIIDKKIEKVEKVEKVEVTDVTGTIPTNE